EIMTPGYYIPMFRSQYDLESGIDESNPREQLNQITSWLDASLVYGSDNYRGDWLRTFENGLLKTTMTSEGPIPPELDPTNDSHPGMSFEGFGGGNLVVGDVRGNEHISLLALHTLFLREHNRLAVEIFSENPSWNDEQIYQSARLRVAGILQAITYNEFLPALGITLSEYEEYDSSIDPTILNAFTHSAFRMGHSQIGSWTMRLNENRTESVEGHIRLNEGFFDTRPLTNGGGIDPVLRGLAYQVEPKLDLIYSDDLRNQMFGQPNAGGMDLCAIDINRARDHGMPDYNTIREALGLEKITNWSQITSDSEVANKLLSLYPEPGYSDMFIGMLAEDHLENSSVGISVHELIKLQYEILRDSDHLFYLNNPEVEQIRDDIHNTTMADIILRNTMIEKIQCNVFFAEQNMDNMECIMNNEDKGFDPWVALEENDEDTILDDIAPNLVPPVKDTPGFVFSTTLVSLLGAVVYISKRKENN
ncbi:MAG TPA: peroxidase family protein, partial [Candidatus Poseidoniaceae archaeon]|nr:peroxidase family protein [Candidatus Poseidoniaceae archaeon]